MKRMLQYNKMDNGYACYENEEIVFSIMKSDLQFNVKAFYDAFYSDGKDYEDIEIVNCIPEDKDGKRIYDCINQLMDKIKEKLAELKDESEEK